MNKLNKTFLSGNVLTAAELNLLTAKIDEIVNNLPSSTTTPYATELDIIDRVNSAKSQLEEQIAAIRTQTLQFDDGNTHVRTDQELLDLFKSAGKEVLVHYGVCDSEGHPFFSALIDENGVKPAAIIGAITDNNGKLSSSIGISADLITLDGNTTLIGKLTALQADIANASISNLNISKEINVGKNSSVLSISDLDHAVVELEIIESGNSDHGCVYTKLSNEEGLVLNCAENTSNVIGEVVIGRHGLNMDFGIYVSKQEGSSNSISGFGYTGVINGARYINGICVGAA